MIATIFFNDAAWLRDDEKIFDARFNGSIIPSGSVVCGFMVADDKIIELLHPPYMASEEQKKDYARVLDYARAVLRDEWE